MTPRKMSEVLSDPPAVIRRKTDIAEVGDSTGRIMHSQRLGQQQRVLLARQYLLSVKRHR